MPIDPAKAARYPGGSTSSAEWRAFRAFLLFRAANRCEGTPARPDCRAANGQPHPETGARVILTIAHMDHDETHADPARCRALCQKCHNGWDAAHRAVNAARTRAQKAEAVQPRRIQMTRQRPWRCDHPTAVIVARPSMWGNPWRVGVHGPAEVCADKFWLMLAGTIDNTRPPNPPVAEVMAAQARILAQLHQLAGRDLACWCPPGAPCHADALLDAANR